MAVPVLALDIDGVVLDAERGGAGHWTNELERRFGISRPAIQRNFFEPHWEQVVCGVEPIEPHLARALAEIDSTGQADVEAVLDCWFEADFHPLAATIDEAAKLCDQGVRIVLATDQEHRRATYLAARLAPMLAFEHLYYSADLGVSKPDPRFFRRVSADLADRFGDTDVVFVDDRLPNVKAARAAGWRGVWATDHVDSIAIAGDLLQPASVAYQSNLSAQRQGELRAWHDRVASAANQRGVVEVDYQGCRLRVPPSVFAPTPTSDLLAAAVRAHVVPGSRVLDMGTGAGANAIIAARGGAEVVACDINPEAAAAAAVNADTNGVGHRVQALESDLFERVDGSFDLMIIDPPFRWFTPQTMAERAMADQGYEALDRFLRTARWRLRPGGAVLLFFGTSADADHLDNLRRHYGWSATIVAERTIDVRGEATTYFVRRLAVDD